MSVQFELSDFFDYYVSVGADVNLYSQTINKATDSIDPERDFFYESIRLKQEFAIEQPKRIEDIPERGDLLPHQRFMARFLSPYTPYDRILAFHGMGTGKTCLYVGVAELAKKINPGLKKMIVLVRNPTLKNVALNEIINKCTPTGKYRYDESAENIRLRATKVTKTGKKFKPQTLELRRMAKALENNYVVMTYTQIARLISELQTDEAIQEQFDNCYIVIDEAHNLKRSLTTTAKPAEKHKESLGEEKEQEEAPDEFLAAMQRVLQTTTNTEEAPKTRARKLVNKYDQIFRMLHLVKGSKIMLLTGTPMRDSVDELCDLMNLILPLDSQLNKGVLQELYNPEGQIDKFKGKEFARKYFYGNISFLRSMQSIAADYKGQIVPPLQKNHVYPLEFDSHQNVGYQNAFSKDTEKRKIVSSDEASTNEEEVIIEQEEEEDAAAGAKEDDEKILGWNNSRFASMFVYPPESEEEEVTWGIEHESKFEYYYDKEGKRVTRQSSKLIYAVKLSPALQSYLKEQGNDEPSQLQQLNTLSNKYAFIIQDLLRLENQRKKAFVYIRFGGGGGALMFSALLSHFGWTRLNVSEEGEDVTLPLSKRMTKAPRFIILTGFTSDAGLNKSLIDIYNHPENSHGEYVQVVIGSHVIGEGVSFLSVRKTYVVTPWFNDATTDQAVARSIRSFSHNQLPPEEQTIDIYKLVSMTPDEAQPVQSFQALMSDFTKILEPFSVDLYLYDLAEKKDIRIKQMERLMKYMAVDCSLNRARNVPRTNDGQLMFRPGSKECDFMQQCDYDCYGVPKDLYDPVYITDTYNFYYASKEMKELQHIISVLFEIKSAYDFKEMFGMLVAVDPGFSSIVLARALAEMIQTNKRVRNRHGFLCLLRTDRDMYFLVDDPLAGEHYTSAYFADMPYPKMSINNYDKMYEKVVNEQIEHMFGLLEQNVRNNAMFRSILDVIPAHILSRKLRELWIQTQVKMAKQQPIREVELKLLKLYESQFGEYKFDGQTYMIHTIPKDNLDVMEDEFYVLELPFNEQSRFMPLFDEQLKNDFANKRKIDKLEQKSLLALSNPYGYYAVQKTSAGGDKQDLFLKQIKTPKIKEDDGQLDIAKEGRLIDGGTLCGTGNFKTAGVIRMLLELILRENQLSSEDPLMETYYPFQSTLLSEHACSGCATNTDIVPLFEPASVSDTTSLGAKMKVFLSKAKSKTLNSFDGLRQFITEVLGFVIGKPEDKNYWNEYAKKTQFKIYLKEQLARVLSTVQVPAPRPFIPSKSGKKQLNSSYLQEDNPEFQAFIRAHPEYTEYYRLLRGILRNLPGDKAKDRLKLIDFHPEPQKFLLSEASIDEMLSDADNAAVARDLGLLTTGMSVMQAIKQIWGELLQMPAALFGVDQVDLTGKTGSDEAWRRWLTQIDQWNFVPFVVLAYLLHNHPIKHQGKRRLMTVADLCKQIRDWFDTKGLIDPDARM